MKIFYVDYHRHQLDADLTRKCLINVLQMSIRRSLFSGTWWWNHSLWCLTILYHGLTKHSPMYGGLERHSPYCVTACMTPVRSTHHSVWRPVWPPWGALTILCDGLYDPFEELVVVDDVEEMESKEVALEYRTRYRRAQEDLVNGIQIWDTDKVVCICTPKYCIISNARPIPWRH